MTNAPDLVTSSTTDPSDSEVQPYRVPSETHISVSPDTVISSSYNELANNNKDDHHSIKLESSSLGKRRRSCRIANTKSEEHEIKKKNIRVKVESSSTKKKNKKINIKQEFSNETTYKCSPSNESKIIVQISFKSNPTPPVKQEAKCKDDISSLQALQEEFKEATLGLGILHPEVVDKNDERRKTLLESCGMRNSITDAIISTMLSQNTTDKNSKAAWKNLKKQFPRWESVLELKKEDGNLDKLENAIRVAGLAKTRAERIHNILETVEQCRGKPCLNYLSDMSTEDVKSELSKFKGLGPKTISCVLLFGMARPEFPVDTHVLRISKRMKWIPDSSSRESAYDEMNDTVPAELKMDLHCLLVKHGKHCHACAANHRPQFPPTDGSKLDCPLNKVLKKRGDSKMYTGKNQYSKKVSVKREPARVVKIKVVEGEDSFAIPDQIRLKTIPNSYLKSRI